MGSGKGHVFIIRVVLRKSHLVIDSLSKMGSRKGHVFIRRVVLRKSKYFTYDERSIWIMKISTNILFSVGIVEVL
jgi:hypothetical protein